MSGVLAGACVRQPGEILVGEGALAAAPVAAGRRGRRVLVCSDPGLAETPHLERLLSSLREAGLEVTLFAEAAPELPLASVEEAVVAARAAAPEVVVGFGGGTSIDLAKLVALRLAHPGPLSRYYGEQLVPGPCLPVVAIPTTSGTGSEVTPVAVLSDPERELKVGISSAELIPAMAICDPVVTVGAPAAVTAFAGIDALVHAVEARTAIRRPRDWGAYDGEVFQGGNPASDMLADRAIGLISSSLERALADGSDLEARSRMQRGALLAGLAFAQAGTAGAHALQYAIGARTHTPHGLGVGLLAPFVLDHVSPAATEPLAAVARAMGIDGEGPDSASAAVAELRRLSLAAQVPPTLAALGVEREELPRLAAQGAQVERLLRNSPMPLALADLERILERAWSGELSFSARS